MADNGYVNNNFYIYNYNVYIFQVLLYVIFKMCVIYVNSIENINFIK